MSHFLQTFLIVAFLGVFTIVTRSSARADNQPSDDQPSRYPVLFQHSKPLVPGDENGLYGIQNIFRLDELRNAIDVTGKTAAPKRPAVVVTLYFALDGSVIVDYGKNQIRFSDLRDYNLSLRNGQFAMSESALERLSRSHYAGDEVVFRFPPSVYTPGEPPRHELLKPLALAEILPPDGFTHFIKIHQTSISSLSIPIADLNRGKMGPLTIRAFKEAGVERMAERFFEMELEHYQNAQRLRSGYERAVAWLARPIDPRDLDEADLPATPDICRKLF